MPRYFFNVEDGERYLDHEGSILGSDDEARRYALRALGEILDSRVSFAFWNGEPWLMHIDDDTGRRIATLHRSANIYDAAPTAAG